MGYFIETTEAIFEVKKEHFDAAYKALCALNDRDDLKSGGSYGGDGIDSRSSRPAGMDYHPAKWFSWMPADYPAEMKSVKEILEGLGFEVVVDDNGNIANLYYDSKIGNEDHFFEALAPYVTDGSYICWRGEDGREWRWLFNEGAMDWQTLVSKAWE